MKKSAVMHKSPSEYFNKIMNILEHEISRQKVCTKKKKILFEYIETLNRTFLMKIIGIAISSMEIIKEGVDENQTNCSLKNELH